MSSLSFFVDDRMQGRRLTTDAVEPSPNVELWGGVRINLSTADAWRLGAVQKTEEIANLCLLSLDDIWICLILSEHIYQTA